MKKILMTGGTGMLGIALIHHVLQYDCEVTVLARGDSKRIENIPVSDRVHIVHCDMGEMSAIDGKLDEHYDIFYHFGWQGTTGQSRDDMFLQNHNVKCTLDAVELAHRKGCEVFIGAGSQAEYGRVDGEKISPSTPARPVMGYGMAKLCAGQMSRVLSAQRGMRHIWFRILSLYGPYDNEGSMVMSGIRSMLSGQAPQYTKGEQMWDYLYCKDAAKAFWLAAQKGKDGSVYCLGSGQVRPLKEYILDIWKQMEIEEEPQFGAIPYYPHQVMYLCADITNLQQDLGFEPEYKFEDGIRETIEWCKEHR